MSSDELQVNQKVSIWNASKICHIIQDIARQITGQHEKLFQLFLAHML